MSVRVLDGAETPKPPGRGEPLARPRLIPDNAQAAANPSSASPAGGGSGTSSMLRYLRIGIVTPRRRTPDADAPHRRGHAVGGCRVSTTAESVRLNPASTDAERLNQKNIMERINLRDAKLLK